MTKKIAIIGAGISGLASAVRLANAGFKVDVYEKALHAGGKMNEINTQGYRFDTGPSLFTLPELLTELYTLCNTPAKERIEILKPEISCRYFYPDKTILDGWQDPDKFAREVEDKTNEPATHVREFLAQSEKLYQLTAPLFIFKPLTEPQTLLSWAALKVVKNWRILSPFENMYTRNKKWFDSGKVQQLFNRFATYNGSDPYRAPATLNVIPHLEHNMGAYLPKGGIYQIAKSLQKLAKSQGAVFHFNTPIDKVVTLKNKVTGIEVKGKNIAYDFVISDVDVFTFYSKLLKQVKLPSTYKKQELSSSAIIFYWGIKKTFPQLDLHNILFSEDYKGEFASIFDAKEIFHDPTVYIYVSSKLNETDAPTGCENWFVMINAPHNIGQQWDKLKEQARKYILQKIKKVLEVDVEDLIDFEQHLDPVLIESKTDSFRGALYGPSSNSKMAAFLRHPNFTRRIKNLYFTGGSVHPGGGIPLCMSSAKIVAQKIIETNHL